MCGARTCHPPPVCHFYENPLLRKGRDAVFGKFCVGAPFFYPSIRRLVLAQVGASKWRRLPLLLTSLKPKWHSSSSSPTRVHAKYPMFNTHLITSHPGIYCLYSPLRGSVAETVSEGTIRFKTDPPDCQPQKLSFTQRKNTLSAVIQHASKPTKNQAAVAFKEIIW